MAKVIILSIALMSFAVPIGLSGGRVPRRALRRTQGLMMLYILLWAFMCLVWYPTLVTIQ